VKDLPKIIETDRLVLRPFTLDDSHDVFAYASDPEVTRFMDWPTHQSQDVSKNWIQLTLEQWGRREEYTWGICLKAVGNRIVGAIGCSELNFKVSFGYVLNKQHWGKGIATEASKALVDELSSIEGVRRIWATCDVDNNASAGVLAKSGCILEGTLRNWSIRPNLPGRPVRDSYVFARTVDA
jgi:ribosomal-protein-alanine N-acetyltransferase